MTASLDDGAPVTFRAMTGADVPQAAHLSRAEGWPHTEADWRLILSVSAGTVGIDWAGRVVATAIVTPYGNAVAALALVIVAPELRGRGLGRRLATLGIETSAGRELRLVATAAARRLYEALGFRAVAEIVQHQGIAVAGKPPGDVGWAGGEDLAAIVRLDAAAFGAPRKELLAALLGAGPVAVLRDGGRITAFAARRPFGRGTVVGPVVAPDRETAARLVAGHLAALEGTFVRVDTRTETGLATFLATRGLTHAGGGTLMVRAPSPSAVASPRPSPSPAARTFAIAAQALG